MEEVQNSPVSGTTQKEPGSNGPKTKFGKWLDRYFHISERGSSILRELIGGLVIFLAMFYILPLNSNMLSGNWAYGATVTDPITGIISMSEKFKYSNVKIENQIVYILIYGDVWATVDQVRAAVFAATAISASITTILMGFYGKLPVGLASGLGINSLIAYTVMLGMGFNFAQCMCLVLLDGILFLIISITPLRGWIVRSIPKSLKFAISAGIGFFICFIGLYDMGIIKQGSGIPVALGDFTSVAVGMGLLGVILVLVLSSLPQKNKVCFWINKLSVIISIVVMGIICGCLGQAGVKDLSGFYDSSYSISALGNFGTIFGSAFMGFDVFAHPMAYALVFSLLFIDFFDTTGTLVGVEAGAGMVDDKGNITVNDRPAMITDAIGTCVGAVCGTTTVTSFVESTTGVAAGARTGLAAVTTGLLFGLSLLIYPALSMFSSTAVTGLALVYVGVCMFKNLEKLEWHDWVAVTSGFFTVIIMCLSYSISDGIAWGFIMYTVLTLASGKFKKSDVTVACCAAAFVVLYIVKYATGLA
jgi:AGZA family xanthine/uracil permease-like MFS transporter